MRDNIILADELGEPENLGWTKLGPIDRDDCWHGTGWVYCKAGQFAVFNEALSDMEFKEFLEKSVAVDQLYCRRHRDLADRHEEAAAQ